VLPPEGCRPKMRKIDKSKIRNTRYAILTTRILSTHAENIHKSFPEFIRSTCLLRGRAKSQRSRRQVKKDRRRSYCYVENVFGRQRRRLALQPAAVEWVVRIHSNSKNEPKVKFTKFDLSCSLTSK
jgi:hypothetical protein